METLSDCDMYGEVTHVRIVDNVIGMYLMVLQTSASSY